MHSTLQPYARYLKDVNLFTMPVDEFSIGVKSLKLYKRTFIKEQFALTVPAFGVIS